MKLILIWWKNQLVAQIKLFSTCSIPFLCEGFCGDEVFDKNMLHCLSIT